MERKIYITGVGGLLGYKLSIQSIEKFKVFGSYNLRKPKLKDITVNKLDLTNFLETKEIIETLDAEAILEENRACGQVAIAALLGLAKKQNLKADSLSFSDSSVASSRSPLVMIALSTPAWFAVMNSWNARSRLPILSTGISSR